MSINEVTQLVSEKEAILFDLFHTLTALESTWLPGPRTSELLGISREPWDEQLHKCSRERLTGEWADPVEIVRTMARAVKPDIPEDLIATAAGRRVKTFENALLNPPPETLSVLKTLQRRGKKIALISNADVTEARAWPRSPMAPFFDEAIFSCHVGRVKPEPEIYRLCMKRLDVEPSQCVFVGDGGSDELAGARALGISTIMIAAIIREIWPDKIEERRRNADFMIERLVELIE